MSNIIDSIQVSGVTYQLSGSSSGGNNVVELTQAEYDALVDKDPTAFYIITDATAGDLTQYWTSAQTQSAITSAVSGKASQSDLETVSGQVANKQDTLQSGTNIKTINNESLLGSGNIVIQGGGGKAIEAGRGISITTGETADTVSFNLPISATSSDNSGLIFNIIDGNSKNKASGQLASAFGISNNANGRASFVIGSSNTGTGESSFVGGANSEARGNESFAFGYMAKAIGDYSIAFGSYFPLANNTEEVAIGKANVSHTGSTDADKTLFSVGNGINNNTRHNAFEIRQNGDIYITLGDQDVKLQDHLGGGGGTTYSGVSGITINNNNEIYYDGIYKTWLTSDHSNDNAVYWFKGSYSKIWIDDNTPSTSNSDASRHQFSFGAGNNLKGSICGVAFGQMNTVKGFIGAAFGEYNNSNNRVEFTIGQYNVSSSASTTFGDSGNTLFSVGNGTSNARHNAFEIRQNGDIYLSLNGQDVKLQDQLGGGGKAVSGGTNISVTTGETSDTINCTIPFEDTSNNLLLGYNLTFAAGTNYSLGISPKDGNSSTQTKINGMNAIAIGTDVTISGGTNNFGEYSVAIGKSSKVYGVQSTALGTGCNTSGNTTLAIGRYSTSNGDSSVAIGNQANVSGNSSVAIGNLAKVSGDSSVAIGSGATANGVNYKTNINNQLTIDTSNQVYISNSANTSTYCLQEKIENTEAALGGLKLVKLTQAQYDALATKDNSTLYVIVN